MQDVWARKNSQQAACELSRKGVMIDRKHLRLPFAHSCSGGKMRNLTIAVLIFLCLGGLFLGFSTALAKTNLKNLDQPIELDAGESKRMYVTFNHSTHKDIACRTCHHMGLPGNRYAPCTNPECHALTSPSERNVMSVYMAYHAPGTDRSCAGCHASLASKYPQFKGCKPCHMTLSQKGFSPR